MLLTPCLRSHLIQCAWNHSVAGGGVELREHCLYQPDARHFTGLPKTLRAGRYQGQALRQFPP